jgi:hypothetical protein
MGRLGKACGFAGSAEIHRLLVYREGGEKRKRRIVYAQNCEPILNPKKKGGE